MDYRRRMLPKFSWDLLGTSTTISLSAKEIDLYKPPLSFLNKSSYKNL